MPLSHDQAALVAGREGREGEEGEEGGEERGVWEGWEEGMLLLLHRYVDVEYRSTLTHYIF